MICSWAMGITQHKNGVANVQTIVNFALLRGQIGRRGAGVCPVRGHSNVQGDRTVGIWEKMSPEFMKALGKEFNFTPPPKHGFDTVRAIQAMHEGQVKVFIGLGGNFLAAAPDTQYTAEALQKLPLDGADLDQAQPRPSHHGRAGPDSALPGPHRNRRAEVRPAVRDRRRYDLRRAHVERRAGAGLTTSEKRAGHRGGNRPRHAPRQVEGRLGRPDRQLRPHPRAHRARRSGVRAIQRPRPPARRVLSAQRAEQGPLLHAVETGPLHGPPDPRTSARGQPTAVDDASAATISSTRRSTARTTVTAASSRAAGSSSSTPRTWLISVWKRISGSI